MLFNSVHFAIFLPIIFAFYWISPAKLRWIVILISSYYFYMSWDIRYIVLILFITVCSYFGAIAIEKVSNDAIKRMFLYVVVAMLIGLLVVFKYLNFVLDAMRNFFSVFHVFLHPLNLTILLPVGISFYTFQAISYIIDVYQNKIKAEYHFGKYAAFISFFPQLVAGPIERSQNLLPQIRKEHVFDYSMACYGMKRMAWGFFKKLVIADTLAILIDPVFSNIYDYQGGSILIASLFFSFQIYCDFSGYSDIAMGTANLFGIQLMQNFKSPYLSSSLKEFWKRWHISLSSWFQDYVYVPLGGNRRGKINYYRNIMIIFLISGLWHGAAWHFVLWGGIHGCLRIFEDVYHKKRKKHDTNIVKRLIAIISVFFIINLTWLFFRVGVKEACFAIKNIFVGISNPEHYLKEGINQLNMGRNQILQICISLLILLVYDFIDKENDVIKIIAKQNVIIRWGIYYTIGFFILLWGIQASPTAFIYFQF